MTTPKAIKHDQLKLRMDLLEPVWLEGVASVMTFGAEKYAPNNWREGFTYTRIIGAMMRHTTAIARGEDHDPETGKLHAYHVSCCAMFLSWFQENRRDDLDDRIKLSTKQGSRSKRTSTPTAAKGHTTTAPALKGNENVRSNSEGITCPANP